MYNHFVWGEYQLTELIVMWKNQAYAHSAEKRVLLTYSEPFLLSQCAKLQTHLVLLKAAE